MMALLSMLLGLFCGVLMTHGVSSNPTGSSLYSLEFMKELCAYVGVSYIRNPTDPLCKYVWCWNGHPFTMECSPGRMVHPHFYWSERDPCTELDTQDRCLLRILKGKNWITNTSGRTYEEVELVKHDKHKQEPAYQTARDDHRYSEDTDYLQPQDTMSQIEYVVDEDGYTKIGQNEVPNTLLTEQV